MQAVSASVNAAAPGMTGSTGFGSACRRLLLLSLGLSGMAGCAGSGRLYFLTSDYRQIEPQGPLVYEKPIREGYFWIDPNDQVRIALRNHSANWLDPDAAQTLELSLVLDGVPANLARNYPVTRRTLRGRAGEKNEHVRFASTRGVAAVWLDSPDRIHGRFRISTRYQKFSILLGWYGSQQVLVLGEFAAILDRDKTEAILARTEADGMQRSQAEHPSGLPVPVVGPSPVP